MCYCLFLTCITIALGLRLVEDAVSKQFPFFANRSNTFGFDSPIITASATVYTANTFVGAGVASVLSDGDTISNGLIYQLNFAQMLRGSGTIPPPSLSFTFTNGIVGRALLSTDLTASINIYGSPINSDVLPTNPNPFAPIAVLISKSNFTNTAITIRDYFPSGSMFTLTGNRFTQKTGDPVGSLSYYIVIYGFNYHNTTFVVSYNVMEYTAAITSAVTRGFLSIAGQTVFDTIFNMSSFLLTHNSLMLDAAAGDRSGILLICFGRPGSPRSEPPKTNPATYRTRFTNNATFLSTGNYFSYFTRKSPIAGYLGAIGITGPLLIDYGASFRLDGDSYLGVGSSYASFPLGIVAVDSDLKIQENSSFIFCNNVVEMETDNEVEVFLFTYATFLVVGGGNYKRPIFSYFLLTDNVFEIVVTNFGASSCILAIDQSYMNFRGVVSSIADSFLPFATISCSNNIIHATNMNLFRTTYTPCLLNYGAALLFDNNEMYLGVATQASFLIDAYFEGLAITNGAAISVSNNVHELVGIPDSRGQWRVIYLGAEAGQIIELAVGGKILVVNNTLSSPEYFIYSIVVGDAENSFTVRELVQGYAIDPTTGDRYIAEQPSMISISGNSITTTSSEPDGIVNGHILIIAADLLCYASGAVIMSGNTVRGGQPQLAIGIVTFGSVIVQSSGQLQINSNVVDLVSVTVYSGVGVTGEAAILRCETGGEVSLQNNKVTFVGANQDSIGYVVGGAVFILNSLTIAWNGTVAFSNNQFSLSNHKSTPYNIMANAIAVGNNIDIMSNSRLVFTDNNSTLDRNQQMGRSLSVISVTCINLTISNKSSILVANNKLAVRADASRLTEGMDVVFAVAFFMANLKVMENSSFLIYNTSVTRSNASGCSVTGISILRSTIFEVPTQVPSSVLADETLSAVAFQMVVSGNSSLVIKGVTMGGHAFGEDGAIVSPSVIGAYVWYFRTLIDQASRFVMSDVTVNSAHGSNNSAINLSPPVLRVAGGSVISFQAFTVNILPIFSSLSEAYLLAEGSGNAENGLTCTLRAVDFMSAFIEITSGSSMSFTNITTSDLANYTGSAELCRSTSTLLIGIRPLILSSDTSMFLQSSLSLEGVGILVVSKGSRMALQELCLRYESNIVVTSQGSHTSSPDYSAFASPSFQLRRLAYRTNIALVSIDLEARFVVGSIEPNTRAEGLMNYISGFGRALTVGNYSKLIIDKSSSLEVSACSWGVGFGRSDVAADTFASILLAPAPPNEGMPSRGAPLDRIVGVSINAQNISLETAASNSMAPLMITQVKGMAVNALHRFDDVDVSKISVSRAAGDPKASYHGEVVGVEVYCETLQVAGQGSVAAISITNTTLTTLEGSDSITRNGNVLIPAYSSLGGSGSTAARPLAGQQGTIDGIRVTVNNYTQLGPSATTVLNVARNTIDISEFASFRNYYSMDALAAATPLSSLGSGIAVSFANPTWIAPTSVATLFSIANGLSKGAVSISENIIRSTSSPLCAVARGEETLINLRTRGGIRVDLRGTQSSVNGVGTALNVSIQGNSIDLLSAEAADLFSSQCPFSSSLLPLAYYYPTAESYANTTVTRPPPWALNQCPMPVAEGVGISLNYFPATTNPLTVPMLSVAGDIRVKGNSIRSVGMSGGRGGVRIEMVQPFILSTEPQISSQPSSITDVSDNLITVANSAHGSSVSTDRRVDPKGISINSVTSRIVIANNNINVSRLMAAPPQLSSVVYNVPLNAEGVARALAATRGLAVSMQFADGWTSTLMSLEMKVENNTALLSTSYAVGSLGHSWKAQSLLSLSRLNSHSVTGENSSIALSSNSFSWRSFLEVPSASLLPSATASDRYMSWEAGAPQETEVMATVNSTTLLQVLSALSEGLGEVPETTSLATQGGMMVNGYYILTAQNAFGGPAKTHQFQEVAWPSTLTKASLAASKGTGMLFANSFTFTNGGRYEAACNTLYIGAASSTIRSYIGLFGSPGVLDLVECDATETLSLAVSRSLAITKTVIGTTTPPTTTTAEPLKCNRSLVERLLLPILGLWADLELTDTQVKEGSHSVSVPLSDASMRFFSKNSRLLSDYVASLELSDPILDYLPLMSPIPQVPILRVGGVSVHPLDPNDLNVERNGFGGSSAETHFPSLRPHGYFSISLSQAAVDSFKLASQQGSQSYTVNFSATPSYSIALGERLELFTNAGSLIEAAWAHFIDKEAVAMLANGSAYNGRESPRTQAGRAVYSQLEASVFGQGCIDYYKMTGSSLYVGSVKVVATKDPFANGLSVGSSAIGGSTSVIGILSSSFLAASDLQSLAAMALHSCSDSEMKASFGSYRTLSPFALWDSYFGVVVGNLAAAGVVFSAQLVALVILRFVRKMSDSSELTAIARFPGYTLNTLFALLSGTVFSAARMASLPDPKLEETILGSIVVALSILFPVMLGVFAYKRIARAYQEYALDDWAADKGIARWKLALVPDGVVYSPETRASYQGYISTSRRPEAYWPTYATWGSLIILIGGLARPSSTAGCVGLFGAMSALYLAMAVVVITMRPFRSTLLNAFEFCGKTINFLILACLAVSVYSGDEVGKAATASVIFGLLQVVLTIFRLIYSVLLIYFDRRMLEDAVGLTIVWSHLTDTGAAKRKLFGITEDSETLLNLGLVANTRNLDDHDDGDAEMKSFGRLVSEKVSNDVKVPPPQLPIPATPITLSPKVVGASFTNSIHIPSFTSPSASMKASYEVPRLRGASTIGYASRKNPTSSPVLKTYKPPFSVPLPALEDLELDVEGVGATVPPPTTKPRAASAKPGTKPKQTPSANPKVHGPAMADDDLVVDEGPANILRPSVSLSATAKRKKSVIRSKAPATSQSDDFVVSARDAEEL